jgi:hypothetical protein
LTNETKPFSIVTAGATSTRDLLHRIKAGRSLP